MDGQLADDELIAAKFARHLQLRIYLILDPVSTSVIPKQYCAKAAGFDRLSAEHLISCQPFIPCILCRLFNLMLMSGHAPLKFGNSSVVPIPKIRDVRTIFELSLSMILDALRLAQLSSKSLTYVLVFDRFKVIFCFFMNQF